MLVMWVRQLPGVTYLKMNPYATENKAVYARFWMENYDFNVFYGSLQQNLHH